MNDDTRKYTDNELAENKLIIIQLFYKNVKGKKADVEKDNIRHDGRKGHWLETAMGLSHNGDNAPDILGYEMKNQTTSKTTFGDWSGDYKIFGSRYSGKDITQDEFVQIFGSPNIKKEGRYSWSGSVSPKINNYNFAGQKLIVDHSGIQAIYSYSMDTRKEKGLVVPTRYQIDNLILESWSRDYIKKRLNKFENGWFKVLTDTEGIYINIVFGDGIDVDVFLQYVKTGDIFFDSGMYFGNARPYSQWRANNTLWNKLITSQY